MRQHEEAHQPPPESEYIPFAVIERHIFREVPAESKGPQRKKHALTSQFIDFVSKTTTLFGVACNRKRYSLGRLSAMVFDGTSSAQSQSQANLRKKSF